jgi:D-alanyl-D-alanine carboxypeptidase/D-alanyl-D-alanine-endopeptidase (penicillin-binding protein 4)
MKQKSHWLNPLIVLTVATLAWGNPSLARETNPRTIGELAQASESIDIYVPQPENTPTGNTSVCAAALEPAINAIISNSPNNWGILVESLGERTPLYSHNADRYFIPASNVKLFTTAAALQKLDPEAPIRSTTVKNWINVTNQRSNNNYAETLMRYIGGPQAAKSALAELGIDPKSYRLADGSGLSRRNVATPRALVEILRAMYFSPTSSVFQGSLPIAGVRGTLRNRMRQTPAEGAVYAKTGTLRGVRALSGYLNHPQYGMLVFSIMVNQNNQSGTALVRAIDSIVLRLTNLKSCQYGQ